MMEPGLEKRWQEAVKKKNLTPGKLKAMVEEMECGLTIPHNWNERIRTALVSERAEVEERYGVRIGRTEISCKACGKSWSTFHDCAGMSPERRAEVERLKEEYELPWSTKTLQEWREELGVKVGMTKQEALEKFLEWQNHSRTCERCEGEKYAVYCPLNLICKEATEYEQRNVERDDYRTRAVEANESQAFRADLSQARKRASLRQIDNESPGLP